MNAVLFPSYHNLCAWLFRIQWFKLADNVSLNQQVRNPQRDLPLGIGASLFLCCGIYMLVSVVVVGLVPYYAIDPDTPISSAFAAHGMQWAG